MTTALSFSFKYAIDCISTKHRRRHPLSIMCVQVHVTVSSTGDWVNQLLPSQMSISPHLLEGTLNNIKARGISAAKRSRTSVIGTGTPWLESRLFCFFCGFRTLKSNWRLKWTKKYIAEIVWKAQSMRKHSIYKFVPKKEDDSTQTSA